MKRIISLFLFIMIVTSLYAQGLTVKDFSMDISDQTANRFGTIVTDFEGKKCALIKVYTEHKDFSFDAGSMPIVQTEQKVGEVWVYVPEGVKRLTISHPRFGVLPNYDLGQMVEHAKTYVLLLNTIGLEDYMEQINKDKEKSKEQINLGMVMVYPGEAWMKERNYGKTDPDNDRFRPDYNAVFRENREMVNIINNVQEMLTEHNIQNVDFQSQLETFEREIAMEKEFEDEGKGVATSGMDRYLQSPSCNVRIDVNYSVKETGVGKDISFSLEAENDAPHHMIALCKDSVEGTKEPIDLVINKFIINHADSFCKQIKDYYLDLLNNGREINIYFRTGVDSDIDFKNLKTVGIEGPFDLLKMIRRHSKNNTGRIGSWTSKKCTFYRVRIPFFDEEGQITDPQIWAKELRKEFMQQTGLKLTWTANNSFGRIEFIVDNE